MLEMALCRAWFSLVVGFAGCRHCNCSSNQVRDAFDRDRSRLTYLLTCQWNFNFQSMYALLEKKKKWDKINKGGRYNWDVSPFATFVTCPFISWCDGDVSCSVTSTKNEMFLCSAQDHEKVTPSQRAHSSGLPLLDLDVDHLHWKGNKHFCR